MGRDSVLSHLQCLIDSDKLGLKAALDTMPDHVFFAIDSFAVLRHQLPAGLGFSGRSTYGTLEYTAADTVRTAIHSDMEGQRDGVILEVFFWDFVLWAEIV